MRYRRAAGFTLLEAIVALVVMATSLLALYAWLSSSTLAVTRVGERLNALDDARAALAVVEAINPMEQPRGERTVGALTVRWRAEPLTERRSGLTRAGFATLFDFILYDVQVEAFREGEKQTEFQVRRAGWEAARSLGEEGL